MIRTMLAGKIHRATVTEVNVIILHFVQVRDEEASNVKPKIVRVDAKNHIASKQSPLQTYADR